MFVLPRLIGRIGLKIGSSAQLSKSSLRGTIGETTNLLSAGNLTALFSLVSIESRKEQRDRALLQWPAAAALSTREISEP